MKKKLLLFLAIFQIVLHIILVIVMPFPIIIDNQIGYCNELVDIIKDVSLDKAECYKIQEKNNVILFEFKPHNGYVIVDCNDIWYDMLTMKNIIEEYVKSNQTGDLRNKNIALVFRSTVNELDYISLCSNFEMEERRDVILPLDDGNKTNQFLFFDFKDVNSTNMIRLLDNPKWLRTYIENVEELSFLKEWNNLEYIDLKNTVFTTEQKDYLSEFAQENNCKVLYR